MQELYVNDSVVGSMIALRWSVDFFPPVSHSLPHVHEGSLNDVVVDVKVFFVIAC